MQNGPSRARFVFSSGTPPAQTTDTFTSMLLRVAFERGQTSCALATSVSASAFGTPGSETAGETAGAMAGAMAGAKRPASRGPVPTFASAEASAGTFAVPPCEATNFIAPMKQAA